MFSKHKEESKVFNSPVFHQFDKLTLHDEMLLKERGNLLYNCSNILNYQFKNSETKKDLINILLKFFSMPNYPGQESLVNHDITEYYKNIEIKYRFLYKSPYPLALDENNNYLHVKSQPFISQEEEYQIKARVIEYGFTVSIENIHDMFEILNLINFVRVICEQNGSFVNLEAFIDWLEIRYLLDG